jgi:hypothetical protein
MGFLMLFVALYLLCGLVICWQMKAPIWWTLFAPALVVGGLFILVSRNIWLRLTGQRKRADLESIKAFDDATRR